jgi:integrase/recombinase XerD
MGILRDRMIEEMKLRNFAAAKSLVLYAVATLAEYYKRPSDQLDREQIRSYLLYLTNERKLSPNTMTGQIAGLRFYYNQTFWTCSTYLTDGQSHIARR